jgi:hypothetical protein
MDDETSQPHNCALIVERRKEEVEKVLVWFIELIACDKSEARAKKKARRTHEKSNPKSSIPRATTKTRRRNATAMQIQLMTSWRIDASHDGVTRCQVPSRCSGAEGENTAVPRARSPLTRAFFSCFCFRLCVLTMLCLRLSFQVARRSLNRPLECDELVHAGARDVEDDSALAKVAG